MLLHRPIIRILTLRSRSVFKSIKQPASSRSIFRGRGLTPQTATFHPLIWIKIDLFHNIGTIFWFAHSSLMKKKMYLLSINLTLKSFNTNRTQPDGDWAEAVLRINPVRMLCFGSTWFDLYFRWVLGQSVCVSVWTFVYGCTCPADAPQPFTAHRSSPANFHPEASEESWLCSITEWGAALIYTPDSPSRIIICIRGVAPKVTLIFLPQPPGTCGGTPLFFEGGHRVAQITPGPTSWFTLNASFFFFT